jgi:hypothetical protein
MNCLKGHNNAKNEYFMVLRRIGYVISRPNYKPSFQIEDMFPMEFEHKEKKLNYAKLERIG